MKNKTKFLWPLLVIALGLGSLNYFDSSASAQKSAQRTSKRRSAMLEDLEKVRRQERVEFGKKPLALPEELPPFFNPEDKYPAGMLEDRQPSERLYIAGIDKAKPMPLPEEPKP